MIGVARLRRAGAMGGEVDKARGGRRRIRVK